MHVLIAGGGIAGPALALFLRRAGLESTVFEANLTQAGIGGGLALAPNGMRVLDRLGLAGQIATRGSRVDEFWFRNGRGQTLARYAVAPNGRYGAPMIAMPRATLADRLCDALERQGTPMRYGKRLIGIDQATDGVTVRFDDGSSASGDLLIGADGINSATRRLAVSRTLEPAFTGLIGVGGFAPDAALPATSARDRQAMTFTFGGRGFFGLSRSGEGRTMWWSNLQRTEPLSREEALHTPTEVVRAELLARFGAYHAPVPQLIRHSEGIIQLNIFDIASLPRWHAGRVLVIGDAAHAVSPNAGQGASMALEDAMYLGALFSASSDIASVFATFERERRPRVERIVAEGRRRGVDKVVVGPIQTKMREIMLRVVLNLFGPRADDWLYRYQIEWPKDDAVALAA